MSNTQNTSSKSDAVSSDIDYDRHRLDNGQIQDAGATPASNEAPIPTTDDTTRGLEAGTKQLDELVATFANNIDDLAKQAVKLQDEVNKTLTEIGETKV
ncbi:hypothetical protein SPBR_03871 [Sporothrix brasiliensis 5110]|uniref:Uncharacterized protein n=1 Tax=Sporothrix brasiliensis 5110 TaxID=1398154 RepID=A0A0C2FV05_9PEZI|nr:uncharacterized protein SPBR_03871 [Sporothrix brasiliensis 5110]KIH94873.1 hypothetical protein SPBR_03871 [Sporothrix brasiliensis 5110]